MVWEEVKEDVEKEEDDEDDDDEEVEEEEEEMVEGDVNVKPLMAGREEGGAVEGGEGGTVDDDMIGRARSGLRKVVGL